MPPSPLATDANLRKTALDFPLPPAAKVTPAPAPAAATNPAPAPAAPTTGAFESYVNSRINQAGKRVNFRYHGGPFAGMTLAQATEAAGNEWRGMSDADRTQWHQQYSNIRTPAEGGTGTGTAGTGGARPALPSPRSGSLSPDYNIGKLDGFYKMNPQLRPPTAAAAAGGAAPALPPPPGPVPSATLKASPTWRDASTEASTVRSADGSASYESGATVTGQRASPTGKITNSLESPYGKGGATFNQPPTTAANRVGDETGDRTRQVDAALPPPKMETRPSVWSLVPPKTDDTSTVASR